jgi:hypothetical protein
MDPERYHHTLTTAHAVLAMARSFEPGVLDEAITAIDTAEAAGPVIDPTTWAARHAAMREDREILVAVRDLTRLGQQA